MRYQKKSSITTTLSIYILQIIKRLFLMLRATQYKKTGHFVRSTIKTPTLIQLIVFAPLLNISNIPFFPLTLLIEAHLSLYLTRIQSFFFSP